MCILLQLETCCIKCIVPRICTRSVLICYSLFAFFSFCFDFRFVFVSKFSFSDRRYVTWSFSSDLFFASTRQKRTVSVNQTFCLQKKIYITDLKKRKMEWKYNKPYLNEWNKGKITLVIAVCDNMWYVDFDIVFWKLTNVM